MPKRSNRACQDWKLQYSSQRNQKKTRCDLYMNKLIENPFSASFNSTFYIFNHFKEAKTCHQRHRLGCSRVALCNDWSVFFAHHWNSDAYNTYDVNQSWSISRSILVCVIRFAIGIGWRYHVTVRSKETMFIQLWGNVRLKYFGVYIFLSFLSVKLEFCLIMLHLQVNVHWYHFIQKFNLINLRD